MNPRKQEQCPGQLTTAPDGLFAVLDTIRSSISRTIVGGLVIAGALSVTTGCAGESATAQGNPSPDSTISGPAKPGESATPTPPATETSVASTPSATRSSSGVESLNNVPDLGFGDAELESIFRESGNHMFYYESTLEMVKNAKTPQKAVAEFSKLDNDTQICFIAGLLLKDQYGGGVNEKLEVIDNDDPAALPADLKNNMDKIGPWRDTFDSPRGVVFDLNSRLITAWLIGQEESIPPAQRLNLGSVIFSTFDAAILAVNSTERAPSNLSIRFYAENVEMLKGLINRDSKLSYKLPYLLELDEDIQTKIANPNLTGVMNVETDEGKLVPVNENIMAAAVRVVGDKSSKRTTVLVMVSPTDVNLPFSRKAMSLDIDDIDTAKKLSFPKMVSSLHFDSGAQIFTGLEDRNMN